LEIAEMDDVTSLEVLASTRRTVLENVRVNFALISALAGLTALLGSTVFLYGYLSVFDWRLIWVIEYSDVLKFGLIIFAVLTGYLFLIEGYARDAYRIAFSEDPKTRLWWTKLVTVMFLASFIPNILHDETHEEHYYMLHIMTHLSVLLIGGVTFMAVQRFRNWKNSTARDWATDAILAIFIIPVFGQTFGYYTRDMDGFKHDVILKGVEMQDVGVVMITSHHTVLYSDKGDVIVVPSADVNQIVKKAGASTAVVHPN
jgi:hypothetical protein